MRDCSYEDEPQWIKAPLHYKIFWLSGGCQSDAGVRAI